jgi:hypothetical protein
MSSSRRSHLGYALGTLVMGAALILVAPVSAENFTTIDQSTQPHLKSWSNIIPNANRRFIELADFNNQAVLDRETGLVWEKIPAGGPTTWAIARVVCLSKTVGGRKSWRLPSVHEMASLIDATQSIPTLPIGHPFTINLSSSYWSATLSADNSTAAWHVQFSNGLVSNLDRTSDSFYVWCVRGPVNADTY